MERSFLWLLNDLFFLGCVDILLGNINNNRFNSDNDKDNFDDNFYNNDGDNNCMLF